MNETLTPNDAARILAETSRYEDNLVQRTEGLTAIIWGLVTPAIWMTYGFAAFVGGGALPAWVWGILWIPWVAGGGLASVAIWRSAALSQPAARFEKGWSYFFRWLAFVVALSVAFYFFQPTDPSSPLIIVGIGWLGMAGLNIWSTSTTGRRLWMSCGALLALTGVALFAFHASEAVASIAAIVVSGMIPFAAGFWQTLQG